MRHIGEILDQTAGRGRTLDRRRAELPAPASLSAADATALGSQLLAGGAYAHAFPYLVAGVRGAPSAFAWCRLGKLCRSVGRPADAVRCYDEALALAPADRHALLGRAAALADVFDAPLEALADALVQLVGLARDGCTLSPVLWTMCAVMRSICRRWPHPALTEQTSALQALARSVDGRCDAERRHRLERELDAVLRARELLGHERPARPATLAPVPNTAVVTAPVDPRLLPSPGADSRNGGAEAHD